MSNKRLNEAFDMELFFQQAADLLCIAGTDGYFKKVNPMVCRTLGYSEDELFSQPITEFIYHADRAVTAQHRKNLRNKIPLMNFENRYVTKSGEIIWLSWSSVPIPGTSNIFAIAKNVTHKKKLEDDRNSILTQLSLINKDLRQHAYTTAHDLRTPVSNLITGFGLIDFHSIKNPELAELLQVLKASAEGLKYTLNEMLDLMIQKENSNIQLEEISLSSAFLEVLRSLNSIIKDTNPKIETTFSQPDKINFNKSYLHSIFLNLITNSIKYAKPDALSHITVRTRRIKGGTVLIYADDGQGFDMTKVKDRVFGFQQNFHDTNESKGIGLYLVYNHVTGLGGRIKLKSRPNHGARFIIAFKN